VSFVDRLGLAIARPADAFAVAGEREEAGRSGSDLLVWILVLIFATELRGVVGAIWLGAKVKGALGLYAIVRVLADMLIVDLAFLLVGAVVIFVGAGRKREIGRSFDLACVTVLPLLVIDLAGSVVLTAFDLQLPRSVMFVLTAIAYAWTVVWVVVAVIAARKPERTVEVAPLARRAGWALSALALVGIAVQGISIVTHLDGVRPMMEGRSAPAFTLARIGAPGSFSLESTRGKVTVLDFWATWCQPCLRSLPHLDQLQRAHPEIAVIAINIDEAEDALALFKEKGYTMTLVQGDGLTQQRYGVDAIPHTVVIDKAGDVQRVIRGGGADLERVVQPLLR
jgi:thiol-disulfide isomerase/thioredoxin